MPTSAAAAQQAAMSAISLSSMYQTVLKLSTENVSATALAVSVHFQRRFS